MSVINQVLNQLEQRGVHTAPEQTMVRSVPHAGRRSVMPLLAVGLVLAAGIAAWQWVQLRKPKIAAVNIVRQQPAPAASAAAPATASASAMVEAPPAETLLPASRLSFELSSIPLPSSLRQAPDLALRDTTGDTAPDRAGEPPAAALPPARPAKSQPTQAVSPAGRMVSQPGGGASPMKQVSPAQQADAEFRKAVSSMQQGHIADAIAGYEAVLRLDAGHDAARQALVALLLESRRVADAGRILQDRLKSKPEHTGFAMLLARLQVEQGAIEEATATLEKSLPYADAQADYQAFFAALLQRQNRHKEAITHYQIALQLVPDNGIWLMGYGISLQAVQRSDDAREAFRRALTSNTLNQELQAFVRTKIKSEDR